MITTIRLYGLLGARFGRVHRMAVDNAAEAVRALCSQLRGFEAYLTQSKDKGLTYSVFYGDRNLAKESLHEPHGGSDIRIAPILLGSKKNGVFQTILGVVLVVIGAILYYTPFGVPLIQMGIGLIVGGVVQLLTPIPKGRAGQDRPENQPSYAFNGPLNTQAQGNPVSVLYGRLIVGSAVISAGINAEDNAYVPSGYGGQGSGGGGGGGAERWQEEWQEALT